MKTILIWFVKLVGCYRVENSNKNLKPKKGKKDIIFKDSDRLPEEWNELHQRNSPLRNLIIDLRDHVWIKYRKNITITMIYRTDEEQDRFYANNEKYQKKKFKSPHQFYQAVDLRSSDFTDEEIQELVVYINVRYNDDNYYGWTADCHEVSGNGMHFHIQFYEV